jgi:hypothetical protein
LVGEQAGVGLTEGSGRRRVVGDVPPFAGQSFDVLEEQDDEVVGVVAGHEFRCDNPWLIDLDKLMLVRQPFAGPIVPAPQVVGSLGPMGVPC